MLFEAVYDGGDGGDIALDDIVYSLGRCVIQPTNAIPQLVTTARPKFPSTLGMNRAYVKSLNTSKYYI